MELENETILTQSRVLELLEIYKIMYKKAKRIYKFFLKISMLVIIVNFLSLAWWIVARDKVSWYVGLVCWMVLIISYISLLILDASRKKHLMRWKNLFRLVERNENSEVYDISGIVQRVNWITGKCVINSIVRNAWVGIALLALSGMMLVKCWA